MVALTADHGLEPYYRRELLARYRASDAATKRRGRDWYPAAQRWAEGLADETGFTLAQVVAVLAITSPGIQLRTNLEHTERIMRGEADTGGRFPNVNRPKIAAVLADADHAQAFATGPKVGAFHRAIMGGDCLVLDRWAMFAGQVFGDVDREAIQSMRPKARAALASAYRKAARITRSRVRDFQATVWIQTRESTPALRRGKYVHRRLADLV